MIAAYLLVLCGIYLAGGLAFAIPFVLVGVGKIDPHAAHGSWGFRLLIIPGTMFLWPVLARRWLKGIHALPVEKNAHRCAALAPSTSQPREAGEALTSSPLAQACPRRPAPGIPQSALRTSHFV